MKKVVIVLVSLLLFAGVAFGKGLNINQKAGEYQVQVEIDKNPPVVGNNNMTIGIKDKSDKYVTDAKVRVEYSMPAMPGMPPMNYDTDGVLRGNEYRATMNLSMSGPWNVAVKIIRGGKTSKVKFNIDAQ
jgi:hypothetical protein